jgi:hypothetical protein
MRTAAGDEEVDQALLLAKAEELAVDGYRVLAVAEAVSPGIPEDPIKSGLPPLVLLGYIGFIDPVRPDARESVESCQKAGVTVVMVTGDHPATALAIAKTLGIADTQDQILTGMEIDALGSVDIPEFFDLVQKPGYLHGSPRSRNSPLLMLSSGWVILLLSPETGSMMLLPFGVPISGLRWGPGPILPRIMRR